LQDLLNKLHLNVENRQYEVNGILSDYLTLEKEAKNDDLSQHVHDFKERWLKLRSQVIGFFFFFFSGPPRSRSGKVGP
jgi:hypothetical protein